MSMYDSYVHDVIDGTYSEAHSHSCGTYITSMS